MRPSSAGGNARLAAKRSGEALAATERAACARAIERFKIKPEDRRELEVHRAATLRDPLRRHACRSQLLIDHHSCRTRNDPVRALS
jgi:hypothetical protein